MEYRIPFNKIKSTRYELINAVTDICNDILHLISKNIETFMSRNVYRQIYTFNKQKYRNISVP